MYELRNKHGVRLHSFKGELLTSKSYTEIKNMALALAKKSGERVDIYKIEQVWTTQMLEEAIGKEIE